jgi:GH43 family beta-xylosidase
MLFLFVIPMCILLFGCAMASQQSGLVISSQGIPFNEYFYNPVMGSGADPYVEYHNGYYYYTHTDGASLSIRKSATLSGLASTYNSRTTVWKGSDNGLNEIWAPEIHFVGGYWYAYLAGKPSSGTAKDRRMYVLKSNTPDAMGGWTFIGKLDLPDDKWAIDGTLFRNTDGKLYFIWSGWADNAAPQNIYICEMTDPQTIKQGTSRILISQPALGWEMNSINEGPIILRQPDGKIKCIYSAAGSWTDYYCLGELTLEGDPMIASSWTKSEQPILQMDPSRKVYSPGHNGFTVSPDGKEIWMIYHVAKDTGLGWNRRVRIQKVNFDAQGNINMGGPLDDNTSYAIPSGESVDRILFEAEEGTINKARVASYSGASGGKGVDILAGGSSIELTIDIPSGSYWVYIRYSRQDSHEGEGSSASIPEKNIVFRANGAQTKIFPAEVCGFGQFIMAGGSSVSLPQGQSVLTILGDDELVVDAIILEKK